MKQGIVMELGLQGSRSGSCSRRRKSMSSRFRMGLGIVWFVKGRGLSATADRSQPKNRQPESRMTMIPQLYKSEAARRLPGTCCGGKGCRRVSGGRIGQSYILRPTPVASK